jgi:hypothetical protein
MSDVLPRSKSPRSDRRRPSGVPATPQRFSDTDPQIRSAIEALEALSGVADDIRALEARKVRLIGLAHEHGASWDAIGSALEMSRQAAWEKYRNRVSELLDSTAARARHSEDQTLESAARVLKEVRARRRKS